MTDVVDKNIKILSAALSNNVVDKLIRQRRDLINNIERSSKYYHIHLSEQRKLNEIDNELISQINNKYKESFVNAANFLKISSLIDYYEVENCNARYIRIRAALKNIPMKREKGILSRATLVFDVNAPDEINSDSIIGLMEKDPGKGLFSIRLKDCCIFQNPETGSGNHTTSNAIWNRYIADISNLEDEEAAISNAIPYLSSEIVYGTAPDFVSKYIQWFLSIISELKVVSDRYYFESDEEIYNNSLLELDKFDIKKENIKDQIDELLLNMEEENENE